VREGRERENREVTERDERQRASRYLGLECFVQLGRLNAKLQRAGSLIRHAQANVLSLRSCDNLQIDHSKAEDIDFVVVVGFANFRSAPPESKINTGVIAS
jgi:hypothetical protein